MRVEDRTGNVKPFSIAPHCHAYFMHPRSNQAIIPSLNFMGESTLMWINLLNIEQLHKWEWYYISLQYF